MDKVKDKRYKRTLFVGLGGAGIKTLRRLKEKIKQANGGELPGQVKFLLIDTNATELANFRDFDCNEKVCIAVREPHQRYEYDKKNGDSTHRYIPEKNAHSLKALERGAGQIRSNGHFAVIENQYSNKLIRIFREAADQIEDIDVNGDKLERDPKIEVRMCFSIAGGTGSGTFLPIATLIRSAIRHCELTAYIYSATHFEKFVENSAKKPVMQNAYASLLELDYMMHFGRNGLNYENVKFNFGPHETQHIEQSTRPFEEVYYIDKHTSLPLPESVEFAYNELKRLQENTAEAMHIATTNIITAHTGTVDNVRQKLLEGQFDVGDKFAWVSGFGIAELFLNRISSDSSGAIVLGNKSLCARVGDCYIDEKIKNQIVDEFTRGKWDESKGDNDGDPILNKFYPKDIDELEKVCLELLHQGSQDSRSSAFEPYNLDFIRNKKGLCKSDDEVKLLVQTFEKNLDNMIESLIDSDKYGNVSIKGAQGEKFGISLKTLQGILKSIEETFDKSIAKIGDEKKSVKSKEDEADRNEKKCLDNSNAKDDKKQGFFSKLFGRKSAPVKKVTGEDETCKLKELKSKTLACRIMAERYSKTEDVLTQCKQKLINKNEEVLHWINVLEKAYDEGKHKPEKESEVRKLKAENRVEVENFEFSYYRISLATIKNLVQLNDKEPENINSDTLFRWICSQISSDCGGLQKYLMDAKEQIRLLPQDRRNKDERTEAQKKLERLIDLSTPTMQIDSHGYGSRVNLDHFWYLMTSFKDNELYNNDDSDLTKVEDKDKSPGQLLKELLEPFLQGEKINCVPVDGWENKAILYRVDSAVPAYFVDGVCVGELGGNTLEDCYEELKKTRPHYTPFSHEMLRQKLENGLTVLRPHDNTLDEIALEHWVNFQLLSARLNPRFSINFQPCPKYAHRACTTMGYYSIVSDSLGKNLTASLDDRDNILILGKNRTDAYSMFTRYCKTLVEEYPEYREAIDQIQNENYEEMFVMDGKEYLDIVLPKWTLLKFAEDDPERIQLKKEMDFMDKRKKDFEEKKRKSQKIDNVKESHRDKPEQPNDGKPDDDDDNKGK